MKKLLMIGLISLTMATTAGAFSLPKADVGSEKVKLNKCLMEEGQKQLIAGKLTKDTIEPVAKDVAATWAERSRENELYKNSLKFSVVFKITNLYNEKDKY